MWRIVLFNRFNWNSTCSDDWPQSGCSWAVFDPNDHETWYASGSGNNTNNITEPIGKTSGVYKITNAGQSWALIGDHSDFGGEETRINKIVIDPIDPKVLFAATSEGIYKTDDCTETDPDWGTTAVLSGLIYDLEMKPDDNEVLYASNYSNGNWEIWISQDSGDTWLEMAYQPADLTINNVRKNHITIEVSKAKPDYLYCKTRSLTAGTVFNTHSYYYWDFDVSPPPIQWTPIANHTDPYCYGDGHGFGVEQVDNGEEILTSYWMDVKKYNIYTGNPVSTGNMIHDDVEDIVYHPYNAMEVWACTHGGVEKSTNGGVSWDHRYEGLGVAQVDRFATSFTDPKYILTGLAHDGTQITASDYDPNWEPDWKHVYGGDGQTPMIDNQDPNNMWASYQKGHWRYSSDAFQDPQNYQSVSSGAAKMETRGVLNKQNPSTFFRNKISLDNGTSLKEDVYRSIDKGIPNPADILISNFSTLFPATYDNVFIDDMYTPYNNGDYLIVNLFVQYTWHIFLTKNANDEVNDIVWVDLIHPRPDTKIASIEFDPEDPDIIYVAYGASPIGMSEAEEMIYKIDTQNPVPAADLTKNLPLTSIGICGLEVGNGSSGEIFLATESGVFYTNDELQAISGDEWQLFGTELPHSPIHGIEINPASNTLRVATFGRGVWEIPLPCTNNSQSLVISSNTSWDSYMRMDRSVVVESGATLTIEDDGIIAMPSDGTIVVERGGKLVLDGGLLTNACEDLWQGIELHGNAAQDQSFSNQGMVEITNDGTIENAVCGIETIKYTTLGTPDLNYTGGIVGINGGIFKNNATAIKFWRYTYANSVSLIGNCQFIADDNLILGTDPDNFVELSLISGVKVISSSFTDNRTGTMNSQLTGINSYNSDLNVWMGSEFIDLDYGIYATATTTATNIEVKDSDFIDNYRGIYIGGMTAPRITSNNFNLNEPYNPFSENGYGLYLDESTDYWVEDNIFNNCDDCGTTETGIGIIVNESGSDPNEIYLNVFNDVEYAINVQGNNRSASNGDIGLVIKCNDYNNTENDETIIWSGRIPTTAGIAGLQGENTLIAEDMAGNIFHVPPIVDGDYDDLHNQANDFDYYFSLNNDNDDVEPMDYTSNTVDKYGKPTNAWSHITACESTIHTGGGGGTGDDLEKMSSAQSGIETTEAILTALVDGGDTESLNTEVETSTPPETMAVYNELMNESPNLSETVVESTIEKETVLPNAMVRDVMVANPHTAKSHVLMDKLDERLDPMPEYMKAQILAGKSIQTLKQELEAELAGYQMRKAKAMNNIIRYYKKEETDPTVAYPELVNLFQDDNTVKSSYRLAWLYLDKGEYQLGNGVISNIPTQFNLTEEEQLVYEGMVEIYSMLSGLYQNGNSLEELNAGQLSELHSLASGEVLTTRAYARNILMAIDELEYEEPILHIDLSKSTQLMEDYNKLMRVKAPQMLSVYPNPSTNYVILEYNMEIETEAVLEIKDVNGKTIRTIKTAEKQDQVTVTTENWKPGLYIATLKINGKSIESVKFTLVK